MVMHRNAQESRGIKIVVGVSMALVLAGVAAYLFLIRAQGGAAPSDVFTVAFVAAYMLLMAIVLTLSLFDVPPLVAMRPVLRTAAAAGLLVLGVFALFSIGLLIVLAGVLATIGAIRSMAVPQPARRPGRLEIAAAVIAVTVLMGGFVVTQRLILCSPQGAMSGSTSGFLTGGFSYQCNDGRLTMQSGDCNSGSGMADSNGNVSATSSC